MTVADLDIDYEEKLAADAVVADDCRYMLGALEHELAAMAGGRLLITGGAGFLGYYLTHCVAAWNRRQTKPARRIAVNVSDSFSRGTPDWLDELRGGDGVELIRWDVREPMPAEVGDGHRNVTSGIGTTNRQPHCRTCAIWSMISCLRFHGRTST